MCLSTFETKTLIMAEAGDIYPFEIKTDFYQWLTRKFDCGNEGWSADEWQRRFYFEDVVKYNTEKKYEVGLHSMLIPQNGIETYYETGSSGPSEVAVLSVEGVEKEFEDERLSAIYGHKAGILDRVHLSPKFPWPYSESRSYHLMEWTAENIKYIPFVGKEGTDPATKEIKIRFHTTYFKEAGLSYRRGRVDATRMYLCLHFRPKSHNTSS